MSIITNPSEIINAIRDGEPSDPQHFIDVVETAVDSQTRAATSEISAINAAESARLTQEASEKIVEKGGSIVTTNGVLQAGFETNTKQDKLISGTNIKTFNGESILGEGDISIAHVLIAKDLPIATGAGTNLSSILATQTPYFIKIKTGYLTASTPAISTTSATYSQSTANRIFSPHHGLISLHQALSGGYPWYLGPVFFSGLFGAGNLGTSPILVAGEANTMIDIYTLK